MHKLPVNPTPLSGFHEADELLHVERYRPIGGAYTLSLSHIEHKETDKMMLRHTHRAKFVVSAGKSA